MGFKRSDIVMIIRVDPGDDPGWLGFKAEVAELGVGETSSLLVAGGTNTKLVPLEDRPDSRYPHVDPRGWFFWPTADLRLVEDEG